MTRDPVIIVLGPSGVETAKRIQIALGHGTIHGNATRVANADADVHFDLPVDHFRKLFTEGRPIIGICAAGILIRALGSLTDSKQSEPPVVAVAEDGSAVVPLLGGHRGANDLARQIATALNVTPAITTAGDLRFGVALDAPPEGWALANPEHAKDTMAALLSGVRARITGDIPWIEGSGVPCAADGKVQLVSSIHKEAGSSTKLVYHPRTLALGVGCERDCAADELIKLVEQTLAAHNLAAASLALVCSLDIKADETAMHTWAEHLGVPTRFFTSEKLNDQTPRLKNPSDVVLREVGCPGVAEGAALASVGPAGDLIVEKTKSNRATCAIALAPAPIDHSAAGRARGRLSVIGIGPGSKDWRSAEAVSLLSAATDWVGYGLYLDLISDLGSNTREHRFKLGEEEKRVRHALELAGEGREVALVCSGDAGIYAMASLVYELLDRDSKIAPVSDAASRAEIVVAPGISALQAAAARAGAPLGHDFCAISLSDLLTPWEAIEKRLKAAAEGDFVVALYNPRSRRRLSQLDQALTIIRNHRPHSTPVIVASSLGREDEDVAVTTLAEFNAEQVDMMSVVLIGATETRRIGTREQTRVYTPRGYDAKEPRP